MLPFQSRKQLYNHLYPFFCLFVCLSVCLLQNPHTAENQLFHLTTTFTIISLSTVSHHTCLS